MSSSQQRAPSAMDIGVVVIGRNEGARLGKSLTSIGSGVPVIYVDSGSSDNSVDVARATNVTVLCLDPARPFSAARARNEGFARLRQSHPHLGFIQFVDGDCELAPGWLAAAAQALRVQSNRAIVTGKLEELAPHASVYNQLCAMEWDAPVGDLEDFGAIGGIFAVRAAVFASLDGFRLDVVAGEDSEFGVRVGLAGHTITRLPAAMATHDADMQHFRQWWRRAVRGGHAIGQRAAIHGGSTVRDCVRQRRSTLFWGVALPVLAIAASWPTRGASFGLLAFAYLYLGARIASYRRDRGATWPAALLYARYTVLGKVANALGLLSYLRAEQRGRFQIIEYK